MHNKNNAILNTIKGEKATHTPVWFMRQAGRSQPEYRKLKEKYSLFEITHQPELCAYVTHLPVDNYQTDAAILYKDIMTPLKPIGVDVEIKSGIGPVIHNPIQSVNDVDKLTQIDPKRDVPYVLDTIKLLTQEKLNVPLIGFTGAPFTLASYMIEGGPSKNYTFTKAMMYRDEETWFALMNHLVSISIDYVVAQVEAGAELIQIFDSWVGALNVQDYKYYIKPAMQKLISGIKEKHDVPIILFGVGASHLIDEWNDLPIDVLGLDWRISIIQAQSMGISKTLQGNLDPALLLAPWPVIEERLKNILDQGLMYGKHIFNLGHGVFPEVNPDTLKRVSQFVHDYTKR
ncbi:MULTISPECIES: uroporphyrinogen decarboxylase [Staphylococcus]|uniref:Uroporphyrinogen decarboxylase n=1 Tax=Staphylococcus lugdunensis TaxID=28035 RepID=A0ABX6BVK0_STALU|nr:MULTISPECIES: uroporphyrinogen decarboxylase [Staphylococcus]ADC87228.1 Uroporphyrinogen III decarboxylase [Staphylococcus lugdunensis HKU09-01]ARJ09003.1 uroporphyrinogen decarboxylase [Staphylococcus lugdunensis]ARJ16041.1 uroporphyrinogen decarboxylase [Staphylococcus lugdunensis]ARJ29437.1 uroporphyrinogen decarboxylase [Staphylococcus lugdunensis]EKS25287.1 uroporphyrinogen decarboxylase [Staphylococcus lugdunensis ACS-027-V-Sch2]